LGVDRILDMLRTAVNVTGDLSCAAFISRTEAGAATEIAAAAARADARAQASRT
jgi:Na+/H+-dicarboxylate symporter